jgi:hypothetical protein
MRLMDALQRTLTFDLSTARVSELHPPPETVPNCRRCGEPAQKRSLDHQIGTAMQAVLTTNVIGVTNFFVSQMTGATFRIILCVTVVYLAADKFRDVTEGCRGAFILFAGRAGAIVMISASAMTANIFPSKLKIS